MFEEGAEGAAGPGEAVGDGRGELPTSAERAVLDTAGLARLVAALGSLPPAADDAERIERIGHLERVKSAAAAAQARESVEFDASQRAMQQLKGVRAARLGRGIAEQVALARRESPHVGSRVLGLATALVREMPHTLAALSSGDTSEWRATVLVRETACLSAEDRASVDERLGPRLSGLGNRAVEREARVLAQQLDAASVVARAARAASDRRVTIRPAPDTMTYVTAHLPVADGVAVYAALDAAARAGVAPKDRRGRGQVMADTLVERVTGRSIAEGQPVEIGLVMSDASLLAGADAPARLIAAGVAPQVLPAAVARAHVAGLRQHAVASGVESSAAALVGDGAGVGAGPAHDEMATRRSQVWVRRLFTGPDGRHLVAMDSRRRRFDGLLRQMIVLRDQTCRTPYCDAPIRHGDHVRPFREAGPTSFVNAAGLCIGCNQAKEAPGWRSVGEMGIHGAHSMTVTTPTGHTYVSTSPALLSGMPIRAAAPSRSCEAEQAVPP